jgi:alpha-galactosidase/6-phospho-beta-glucosidase family protein
VKICVAGGGSTYTPDPLAPRVPERPRSDTAGLLGMLDA